MNNMIVPTVTDVVRTIRVTVEELIAPTLAGVAERSAATTIGHLLRYVEQRIEDEGQALLDEVHYLHALLPDALGFLEERPACDKLEAAIRKTLATERDPAVYPSLTRMAQDVGVLRQHACDLLSTLQLLKPGESTAGDELHEKLRQYLSWQIEREGRIIESAFVGQGARR